jgi:hypothetical protein
MKLRAFALGLLTLTACATGTVAPIPFDPDTDAGTSDGGSCSAMCGGKCVDTKTDDENCGKCGNKCSTGASCVQGTCQCKSSSTMCGAECVDTKTDVANCGACGTRCGGGDAGVPMGGGTWGCVNGSCAVVCPMGKTECSGACVDTKTDNGNCGTCGKTCAVSETCTDGLCCTTGQKVCGGKCTSTQTDPQNCGTCGNVCPANTPSCIGGTCVNAPCSQVAQAYCTGMGWKVVPWSNAYPNQPGGSIYCTIDGRSAGSDCDTCGTYRQIVWKNTAKDACNSPMVLQPGQVYGGHNPCTCAANNYVCGAWPMNGCTPD